MGSQSRFNHKLESVNLSTSVDASSLIREMKLTARVETDGELADFLGRRPSAISQWRKRGSVPEAAIIRFRLRTDCKGPN